jgi:hypothetical protein
MRRPWIVELDVATLLDDDEKLAYYFHEVEGASATAIRKFLNISVLRAQWGKASFRLRVKQITSMEHTLMLLVKVYRVLGDTYMWDLFSKSFWNPKLKPKDWRKGEISDNTKWVWAHLMRRRLGRLLVSDELNYFEWDMLMDYMRIRWHSIKRSSL